MIRVNLVLLLAVLVSALHLVGVQYESRRLFSDLDKAHSEARRLATENERLQVENREQSTSLRVEALAKTKLHMRTATPAITHYVSFRDGSQSEILSAPATAMPVDAGRQP